MDSIVFNESNLDYFNSLFNNLNETCISDIQISMTKYIIKNIKNTRDTFLPSYRLGNIQL